MCLSLSLTVTVSLSLSWAATVEQATGPTETAAVAAFHMVWTFSRCGSTHRHTHSGPACPPLAHNLSLALSLALIDHLSLR